jgi:hypothetical protein
VRTLPNGAFVAEGVAPGRYVLMARGASGPPPAPPSDPAQALSALMLGRFPGAALNLWAREELDINGRDITNLSLRLQPGLRVTGRVAVESATPGALAPGSVSVMLSSIPTTAAPDVAMVAMIAGGGSASAQANADGTFEITGVVPGRYRFAVIAPGLLPVTMPGVELPPSRWMPKSVVVGGRDLLDVPLEIRPQDDLRDVVVTLTDRVTSLSGTVFDQAGRPTPAFPIVVFPTDRVYWAPGSRRVQQVRPASDGTFRLTGLAAGEYFVCAATDLDPDDLGDPYFLEQLIAGSFKITIADGEKKVQDLKLAGG